MSNYTLRETEYLQYYQAYKGDMMAKNVKEKKGSFNGIFAAEEWTKKYVSNIVFE